MERRTPHIELDTRLVGLADFQLPASSAKKPRENTKKVKSKEIIEADSDDNTPGIITETVGSYTDESGNKVWICPACGKQDDGSPMIGCDSCDDW